MISYLEFLDRLNDFSFQQTFKDVSKTKVLDNSFSKKNILEENMR